MSHQFNNNNNCKNYSYNCIMFKKNSKNTKFQNYTREHESKKEKKRIRKNRF